MDTSKFLGEIGLAELWNLMTAYVDKKIFIGTHSEYEQNKDKIAIGTLVIFTDDDVIIPPGEEDKTSFAVLGKAILGQMKLG